MPYEKKSGFNRMKHNLEPERDPEFQQKTSDNATLLQASHKVRPQDRIDVHHLNTTKGFQNAYPVSSVSHQTLWISGRTYEDELVKYMSNMPSYLERGKRPQDKVLSVGVLDWERLQKWQSVHKLAPHRHSSYSPSSNTSSSYSADCSTSESSIGQSCSPACQRTRRQLQFPLKGHSSAVKASGESEIKPRDLKFAKSGDLYQHDSFSRNCITLPRSHPDNKLKQGREKESGVMTSTGCKASSDQRYHKEALNVKGPLVIGQVERMEDKPRQQHLCAPKPDAPVRTKKPVSLPRELPGACHLSDSRPILGLRSEETSQKTFLDKVNNISDAKFISDASQSCTVPKEAVSSTDSGVHRQSVLDTERILQSPDAHQFESESAKVGISPTAVQDIQKKKLFITSVVEKPRSSSPFRWRSISINKVGKSSSTKGDGASTQSISKSKTTKYNSENAASPACSDNLSGDRASYVVRSRSSPLRRLLDPLLKPKGSHRHQSSEQLQKGSTSTNRAYKLPGAEVERSGRQSMKVRLDMSSCKKADINCLGMDKKNGSLAVQALVRVALKNGLPLITFAAGNDSNVLIATMKKSGSSDKDRRSWVYTIFNIQDVKKKNGSWRNQGGNRKCPGYISQFVAEMNVYDSKISNSTKEDSQGQFCVRQFVSFSLDLRPDKKTADFQPNDEVAAIIMKIPEKVVEHSSRGESPDTSNCYTELAKSMLNGTSPDSQDLINATVILPSGIHSLPSRGIPSSLIDRWKLCGSCDCGGWDLGCKLTILSNQDPLDKRLSKACSVTSKFELFSQGGQQHEPIFRFASFKDGAFSVEFNSSLSLVQAFSICIAILDSMKLFEHPGSEAKASGETDSVQNNSAPTEGGIPARLVSYPPLSSVGRV